MIFIIVIFIIWGIYVSAMKKKQKEKYKFSNAMLPLILSSLIVTICLGLNYLETYSYQDGIAISNFISYWIIGEDYWSTQLFRSYFNYSLIISIALTIMYSIQKLQED